MRNRFRGQLAEICDFLYRPGVDGEGRSYRSQRRIRLILLIQKVCGNIQAKPLPFTYLAHTTLVGRPQIPTGIQRHQHRRTPELTQQHSELPPGRHHRIQRPRIRAVRQVRDSRSPRRRFRYVIPVVEHPSNAVTTRSPRATSKSRASVTPRTPGQAVSVSRQTGFGRGVVPAVTGGTGPGCGPPGGPGWGGPLFRPGRRGGPHVPPPGRRRTGRSGPGRPRVVGPSGSRASGPW